MGDTGDEKKPPPPPSTGHTDSWNSIEELDDAELEPAEPTGPFPAISANPPPSIEVPPSPPVVSKPIAPPPPTTPRSVVPPPPGAKLVAPPPPKIPGAPLVPTIPAPRAAPASTAHTAPPIAWGVPSRPSPTTSPQIERPPPAPTLRISPEQPAAEPKPIDTEPEAIDSEERVFADAPEETSLQPWFSLAERVEEEAVSIATATPSKAAFLWVLLARLASELLDDTKLADQCISRARALSPRETYLAHTYRWLAEREGALPQILPRAQEELSVTGTPEEKAALLAWIATLQEQHGALGDAEKSLKEYVALRPTDTGGWEALASQYQRQLRWSDACQTWESLAVQLEPASLRGALLGSVAAVREARLSEEEQAVNLLRKAQEESPSDPCVQTALEPLLLRRRALKDYAALLATEAQQIDDPVTARVFFERAGDVLSEGVDDHSSACSYYEQACTAAATEAGPQEKLASLLDRLGKTTDAIAAYEKLLPLLRDPLQQAAILTRIAHLYEHTLAVQSNTTEESNDPLRTSSAPSDRLRVLAEAARACVRALEKDPTFAPALQTLSLLYRRAERWSEYCSLELNEAERIENPEERALRYTFVAELLEEKLKKTEEAIVLYQRALLLAPDNAIAFEALERLWSKQQRWTSLAGLYQERIERSKDTSTVQRLQLALAQLQIEHLQRPDAAVELLRAAMAHPPEHRATVALLTRALNLQERWEELLAVLDQQIQQAVPSEKATLLYRIGTIQENRLHDLTKALVSYQRVLELQPRHALALRALERIHRTENRWEELLKLGQRSLDHGLLGPPAAALHYQLGRIAEDFLGRPSEAILHYEQALQQYSEYGPALWSLEQLLRSERQYERLATLFERIAETAATPALRARRYLLAASVYEFRLGSSSRADSCWERALKAQPELVLARWGLVRLHELRREWNSLQSHTEQLLSRVTTPGARVRVLARQARLAELRKNDPSAAAALYEAANKEHPAFVLDRLRVARTQNAVETELALLEQLASMCSTTTSSLGFYRLRALRLATKKDTDPATLASAYEKALRAHATDLASLDGLARARALTEEHAPLASTLHKRASATSDTLTKQTILFSSGLLALRAERIDAAKTTFEELDKLHPEHPFVLEALALLADKSQESAKAAAWLARAGRAYSAKENRADVLFLAGKQLITSTPTEALQCFREVLEIAPTHQGAFTRLCQLLESAGSWDDLVQAYLHYAQHSKDPKEKARIHSLRAQLLAERKNDLPGAIEDLREAIKVQPEEVTPLGPLGHLYEHTGQWQDALQTYHTLEKKASDATVKRSAALSQARILALQLREPAKAKPILERLVTEAPSDRIAMLGLADVCVQLGTWDRAAELYKELSKSGSPFEVAHALLSLADIERNGKGNAIAARSVIAPVLALAVQEPGLVPMIEDHFNRNDDWLGYALHSEEVLREASAPSSLALRMSVARAYREKLRRTDPSELHLRIAKEQFPQAVEPHLAYAWTRPVSQDAEAATEFRTVLDLDPLNLLALRGLLAIAQRADRPLAAALLASLLIALGDNSTNLEGALSLAVAQTPAPNCFAPDIALSTLCGNTKARFLRKVLAVLEPHLHEIFPQAGQEALTQLPRIPDAHAMAQRMRAIAGTMGLSSLVLCASNASVAAPLSSPKAILLGPEYLQDAGFDRAVFEASALLARVAAGSIVGVVVRPEHIQALLEVTVDANADAPGYKELRKRSQGLLARKERKELERLLAEEPGDIRAEWSAWDEEERARALRAGVVYSRDFHTITQVLAPDAFAAPTPELRRELLAANPVFVDAVRFTATTNCWSALEQLYGHP